MMAATSERYDDDVIARLTGLTLDPETPPHLAVPAAAPVSLDADHSHPSDDIDDSDSQPVFTMRALVSTKEAGVIIGKGGSNVDAIRVKTGVKAGVSKVIQGVHERVLTISGAVDAIARAYAMVAENLLENPVTASQHASAYQQGHASIRLLVPHQLMGTVIGKGGANIKTIQEASGAKMIISKEMLPQSTERTVDVVGAVESIQIAVQHIAQSLVREEDRAAGVIVYDPRVRLGGGVAMYTSGNGVYTRNGRSEGSRRPSHTNSYTDDSKKTEIISIPADMVGCLIGKGGASINHVRRVSGAYISISKETTNTNEREFSISGGPEAVEKALEMLYAQVEKEKQRRMEQQRQANESN